MRVLPGLVAPRQRFILLGALFIITPLLLARWAWPAEPEPTASKIKTPVRPDPAHPFTIPQSSYPLQSRLNHEEGDCMVRVRVDPAGEVDAMQLIRAPIYERLTAACIEAFAAGRFVPATVDGKAVFAWVVIPTHWRIGHVDTSFSGLDDSDWAVPRIRGASLHVGEAFYPEAARAAHAQGICGVRVVVEADGTLSSVGIERSTGFSILDEASVEAIRQALFLPGRIQGVPIAAAAEIYLVWQPPMRE